MEAPAIEAAPAQPERQHDEGKAEGVAVVNRVAEALAAVAAPEAAPAAAKPSVNGRKGKKASA